ncbi:MAG: MtrB/PioB family outer membrane beta-barrel protein [Vicinamibacterales bacterium]
MRYRVLSMAAALLLVSHGGWAQPQTQTSSATPAGAANGPESGEVEVGAQVSGIDGDEARYQRYRDDRNGVFSNLRFSRQTESYMFDASLRKAGFRDQRYAASYRGARAWFDFTFTGMPLNYSFMTRTPYMRDGSTLTLDDNAQRAVQGPTFATNDGTAVGVPCAPGAPPAACSTIAQANPAKANRSIYNSLAEQFELRTVRNVASLSGIFDLTANVGVDGRFTSTKRTGEQPWGASFAFNNAVDVPQPIDQRTNDVSLGASWNNARSMFRLGWDGSWFNNKYTSLTWDNPIFLTDYNNGLLPPNGPYDVSGYSNGNGPGKGRMALAPSNTMQVVSATGMRKLWSRTTVNGTVQMTQQKQNEALIPWTINSVINSPAVFAAFPHLATLPRTTAQADARGLNTLLNFSSRPWRAVNVTVRYRYNKRDVRTPIFDATEYVRFDAVPEENPEGYSPQFDNSRHIFDANVAFTPGNLGTLRVGYGHEAIERHGRGFADVGEHIFRASYDAYSNRFVSLRASVDTGRRRGTGFVEAESGNDEADPITGPGGTQPTLRYFDEADRDRVRGSVVLTVMPMDTVDAFVQFTGGRDKYLPDASAPVSRPGELFGLQKQKITGWTVGLNAHPSDVIAAGASYGRDSFGSFQRSRNANPPPDPSWTDPARDWTLDNTDDMTNASAYVDFLRAIRNTDIRLAWDYSDSDNGFGFGGPRIAGLAALGQFIPLPNVTNKWNRISADVKYYFTRKVGVAVGYYFEKFDVSDWNTIDEPGPNGFFPATGVPRLDWLGGLTLGYGNRPYKGQTTIARLLYRF